MKALHFDGNGLEYFKIWIVNILLIIITCGFYYPWAKVRNNRYFYANSKLEGRHFEYHATGKQLLIGFLIAMTLLIAYVVLQQISPVIGGIIFLVFFLALPWLIWRSLMFNMRMISFSNVRFSFDGTLKGAYFNFMLLPFVFFILFYLPLIAPAILIPIMISSQGAMPVPVWLIGLAVFALLALAFYMFAYMKKRNASYVIDAYRYGQGKFSTELSTKTFAFIALKTMGLMIIVMLAALAIVAAIAGLTVGFEALQEMAVGMAVGMQDPEAMQNIFRDGGIFAILGLLYLSMIMGMFLVLSYSQARQRTYVLGNTLLDNDITFASTLRARSLAWVMVSNLLMVIITVGFAAPWAKVRMARLVLENTQVDTDKGFDDYISQKQTEQSALGEQIGDAFDIDVGVGI